MLKISDWALESNISIIYVCIYFKVSFLRGSIKGYDIFYSVEDMRCEFRTRYNLEEIYYAPSSIMRNTT